MKTIFKSRKKYAFLAISLFLFFNLLSITPSIAIHMQGDGATFHLDKEDPLKYGTFIPEPNMRYTLSIDGSNQGEFTIMDWLGDFNSWDQEIIDYPGTNISSAYPWYFDDYPFGLFADSITDNDYINPWADIRWLNVSAYNAENETLSPYTLNSVFNYYVMNEGGELTVPLNHSIPMQIDIIIKGTGPKVLKIDWLTADPGNLLYWPDLISPSGERVFGDWNTATSYAVSPPVKMFDYVTFVAHETGTYRLLVFAEHFSDYPAYLTLDFLKPTISSLAKESLIFEGNAEDILAIEEKEHSSWQSNWLKFSGKRGDVFRLDLNQDYATGQTPIISIWMPTEDGYLLNSDLLSPPVEGIYEIFFPTDGSAYVSITDAGYGDWYRYSLYLSKYEPINYNIGDNKTTFRISRDQKKLIEFSIEDDSYVRFNYTSAPPGNPYIIGNMFSYFESKNRFSWGYTPYIQTKTVDSEIFYYYYMPAGKYFAMIQNSDETKDSIFEISSKFVDWLNETIPINTLTSPDTDLTQYLTLDFEPDEYYNSLKQGIGIGFNITEPGQYRLNVSILASDNLAAIPTLTNPSAVVFFNGTGSGDGEYYDYSLYATTPNQAFPAFDSGDDFLYIGYSAKWHDMHFNLTQFGSSGGVDNEVDVYTGGMSPWQELSRTSQDTGEFQTSNGTWVLNIYGDPGGDFYDWIKGSDFDVPNINEEDYYWLRFDCDNPYSNLPYFDLISLSNITITGSVNLALVGDSGYNYSDFWIPSDQPMDLNLMLNQETEYMENSGETPLIEADEPYIIGIEEGFYKLLIIPDGWDYSGPVTLRFAVENFWPCRTSTTYNISEISPYPKLHKFQIQNYTSTAYGSDTTSYYPYDLVFEYNDTEADAGYGDYSYFALECYGKPYQWTQLVAAIENISYYELWIIQDLKWQDGSGPYGETMSISEGTISTNTTFEFGVFEDHFILLFGVMPYGLNETVGLKLSLSQYDTIQFSASAPIASYKPPVNTSLILILAIVIPAAVGGAIVVIYIVRKKRGGKI